VVVCFIESLNDHNTQKWEKLAAALSADLLDLTIEISGK